MPNAPLFLLTGPSGAGKSTILDRLLKHPELGLTRFVTNTTRAPRPGEQDGVDYWFVSREAFDKDIADGMFFEWADVYGNYYGSNRKELERLRAKGGPLLMVIDVQGAETMMKAVPEAIALFIDAPKEQMIERISARPMEDAEMARRVAKMEQEEAFREKAQVVIPNENGQLERTVRHVIEEIKQRTA